MTKRFSGRLILVAVLLASAAGTGCSSFRNFFAADSNRPEASKPIRNPFGDYQANSLENPNETMIFRTKRGDGAVEVQIPRSSQNVADFVLPMPAAGQTGHGRGPASVETPAADEAPQMDSRYRDQAPTMSDREITRTFPQSIPQSKEESGKQHEIESGLGLIATDDSTPERQTSYLASIDYVKKLYRSGRYEAGLIEVDNMIRDYPTDPRLHEMRGTLLDRLGRREMAIKSWNQALRFDPNNQSLRRFVERREGTRGIASTNRGNP